VASKDPSPGDEVEICDEGDAPWHGAVDDVSDFRGVERRDTEACPVAV
jgi:hypothetical protein